MDTKVGTDVNLFTAVIHDSPKEWEGELNKLCSVDIRNSNQRTLLHTAIEAGTYEWVKILLMTGADPTIRDGRGLDALQMAKFKSNEKKDDLHRKFILDLIELAVGVKYRDNSTKTIKEDVTSGENIISVPEVQEMDILEKENFLSLKYDIASLAETVNNIQGKMCSLWPGISMVSSSCVNDKTLLDEVNQILNVKSDATKDPTATSIVRGNSEIDEEKTKGKDEGGIVQKTRGKVKDESKIITNAGVRSKLQKADGERAVPLEESSKLMGGRELSRGNSEIDEEKTKGKDKGGIVQKASGKVEDESKIITNAGIQSKLQKADGERAVPLEESSKLMGGRELSRGNSEIDEEKTKGKDKGGIVQKASGKVKDESKIMTNAGFRSKLQKADGEHAVPLEESSKLMGGRELSRDNSEIDEEKTKGKDKDGIVQKASGKVKDESKIITNAGIRSKLQKADGERAVPLEESSKLMGGRELSRDNSEIDEEKTKGKDKGGIVQKASGKVEDESKIITNAGIRSKLQKADGERAVPLEESSKLMGGRELSRGNSEIDEEKTKGKDKGGIVQKASGKVKDESKIITNAGIRSKLQKADGERAVPLEESSKLMGGRELSRGNSEIDEEKTKGKDKGGIVQKASGKVKDESKIITNAGIRSKLQKADGERAVPLEESSKLMGGRELSRGNSEIDEEKTKGKDKGGIVQKASGKVKDESKIITNAGIRSKLQKADGERAVPLEESSKLMGGRELSRDNSEIDEEKTKGKDKGGIVQKASGKVEDESKIITNAGIRSKLQKADGERAVPLEESSKLMGGRELSRGNSEIDEEKTKGKDKGGIVQKASGKVKDESKIITNAGIRSKLQKADGERAVPLEESSKLMGGRELSRGNSEIDEEKTKCKDKGGIVQKASVKVKDESKIMANAGFRSKLQKADGERAVPLEESSKLMSGREVSHSPVSKVEAGSSQGMYERNARCNKSDGTHFTSTVVSGEESKNLENNEKKREKSFNEAKSSAYRKVPGRLELIRDMLQKLSVQGKHEKPCGKPTFTEMSDSSFCGNPLSTGGLPELVPEKLNIDKRKEMSLTNHLPEITYVGENVEADNYSIGEGNACAAIVDKVGGGSKGVPESITNAGSQSMLQKGDGERSVPSEWSSKLMSGCELSQAPVTKVKAGSSQGMYERNARCNKSDGTHLASTVVSGDQSKNLENNEKKQETSLNEAKSGADRKVPGRLELITDMMQKLSVQGKHEVPSGKPSTFPQMSDSCIRGGPLSTGGIPELVPEKLNIDKRKEISLTKDLLEMINVGENVEADNDRVGEKQACATGNDGPLRQLKKVVKHVADIARSSQRLSELQVTEEEHPVATPVSCNYGSGLGLSQDQFFKDILSSGNEKFSMANYESEGCIMSDMMIQAYKYEGNVSMHQAPRKMWQSKEEMSFLRNICHTDVDSTVEELHELCIHDANDEPANEQGKISAICLDSASKKSCTSPHGRDTKALKLRLEGMADDLKPTAGISDGESCYAPCCMQKYQREKESDREALDSDPRSTSENTPHDKDFSQKKNHVSADSHVNSSIPEKEIASADVQISADESERLSSSTAVFEDLNVPGEHHGSPKPTFIGKGTTKTKKPISDQVPNWKYSFSSFLPFKKDNSKQSSVNEELVGEGNASEGNKLGEEPADCVGAKMTTVTGRSSVLGSSFQLPMTDLSKSRESKEMDESQVRRFGHNSREIKETQLQNAEYVATPEMKCLQRKTSHVGQSCPNECQVVDIGTSDLSNQQCVHAMMKMTEIHGSTERKSSFVRKLYEKMYSLCHLSSIMMKFLIGQAKVIIKIDCDSDNIQRIKDKFKDYDEQYVNGSNRSSFADFEEQVIYLAIPMNEKKEKQIIGRFCSSLCLMSVYLAFDNGGKPYLEGDRKNREVYRKLISEASTKKKSREELVKCIKVALEKKTMPGKEIAVMAALSQIISQHGFKEGSSLLRNQLPSLLEFFENHVVSTIKKKCEEKRQAVSP